MPLTEAGNAPDAETFCVYFWMWDGEKPVRCCVTSEALRYIGKVVFGFTDKEANEQLFIIYREQIEQAASLKYDRGNIDAEGVLVTANDLGFSASSLGSGLTT
jgi:hypothetical protein